ncbi:MAG: glycerophosphodiester phosphodiesterase [Clostridiales bacterium]|nr:glycerophosphodiester phosphodiesterase [Clostridiales bacterium]
MLKNKRKKLFAIIGILSAFALFVWANNTSLFVDTEGNGAKLLAHRGLAQTFDIGRVEWDTNTAEIIYPPEHTYLENTLASMQTAFDMGADVVEFDIRKTKDNQLAVFHDDDVSYRTEGQGYVSDHTMAELKQLDIGYGYTADGGKTHPFRGKGIGQMPVIDEVFAAFPDRELLIDVKDADDDTAALLWEYLKAMPEERLSQITVYGADGAIQYLRGQSGSLRLLSMRMIKDALMAYIALGWTGHIPEGLHNMELHLPLNYARFLWGWPHKFVERMAGANTRVVIVGGDGGASEGIDTAGDRERIPAGFDGYIWTNRIDRFANGEIER